MRIASSSLPTHTEMETLEYTSKMHRRFWQRQTLPVKEGQEFFCCVQQELKQTPLSPSLEDSSPSSYLKVLPDSGYRLFQALKQ